MRAWRITRWTTWVGFGLWMAPAVAGLFSATGPVIAIFGEELFLGTAEGHLNGSGTLDIRSQNQADLNCRGAFTSSAALGGAGTLKCSDGVTATFQFQRLSTLRGYGAGTGSRGTLSFTYGLSASDSLGYLKLPPGKTLRLSGKDVTLVDIQINPAVLPMVPSPPPPGSAPHVLLNAATQAVMATLKDEKNLPPASPEKLAAVFEATVLPLLDVRHMTRLAVGRHWQSATPEQQSALTREFKTLLTHSYVAALSRGRNPVIVYHSFRVPRTGTELTVKSTLEAEGAQPLSLDYDMEKTEAGWYVYDIRIGGISLVTPYRAQFAQLVYERGIDGLLVALAARNRDMRVYADSRDNRAWAILFMYEVLPPAVRGR